MQGPEVSIIIVGTGFAGLGMAIRLKKSGLHDFIILEKAGEVGGTWRDNHYPGAACDVPSPVYSFSFERNPRWTRVFSPQPEILDYLKRCADTYQLHSHIRFHSSVEAANFDASRGLWTIAIAGQKSLVCRYLVLGTGGLSRPAYPDIPGLRDFQGVLFHTADWKHEESLVKRRVAVIGTGASAIQVVPELARFTAELKLFQRTPAWVLPKPDGLLKKRGAVRTWLLRKLLYWQFELRVIALMWPWLMRLVQRMAVDFLQEEVADPILRQQLTPSYIMGCKRILLSNDFYSALNRTHVHLITSSIDCITPRGIRTRDGSEHEVEAIICATGFQVAEASAPFRIVGRAGQVLSEVWRDGAEAYLGTTVNGFPNLFIIVGPNSGLGHNSIVFIIESQVQYILDALKKAQRQAWKSIEIKPEVQEQFNRKLQARFRGTVWAPEHCRSWYQNRKGKNTALWPGFSFEFRLRTRFFRVADYIRIQQEARSRESWSCLPADPAPAFPDEPSQSAWKC